MLISKQPAGEEQQYREKKKKTKHTNHLAPLPFLSHTRSWEAYINCKAWESEQTPSLGNQGQPQENICICEMCKLCNQQNIETDKAGDLSLGSTEILNSVVLTQGSYFSFLSLALAFTGKIISAKFISSLKPLDSICRAESETKSAFGELPEGTGFHVMGVLFPPKR